MAGTSRKTGSRLRARFARVAAIGVIAALALVFTPGVASAGPGVTPLVDCYRDNRDGTFWVVLGYKSTYSSTTTFTGSANKVYPTSISGQPTTFYPGTYHGQWTVRLTHSQIFDQDARWILNGTTLTYSEQVQYATVCPPTTQLPADGNGTGTAVALGAAGVVGAAMIFRFRRRLARMAGQDPATDA
jgi:hypothetical protein